MKKEITYISDDGKRFDNEIDCIKYEAELKRNHNQAVRQAIKELDIHIWKYFYPDSEENDDIPLGAESLWLNTDVAHILSDPDINSDVAKEYIMCQICNNKYGTDILQKYFNLPKIEYEVAVRRDYASALKKVKEGSDLSNIIQYGLGKNDLRQLAELHKSNRFRKKIENLLTNCNFHEACSKFIRKDYDDFLHPEEVEKDEPEITYEPDTEDAERE